MLLAALPGCQQATARIKLADGSVVEGQIKGGSKESIWVLEERDYRLKESTREIDRDEIVDVDHPGDLTIAFGTLFLALSATYLAAGACDGKSHGGAADPDLRCGATVTLGAVNALAVVSGILVMTDSKNALADTSMSWDE